MSTQATVSQPATIPGPPLVQVGGALLGIVVLILAVARAIKRLGFAPKSTGMYRPKATANTPLGPRGRAVVTGVEDARLVLDVTALQINALYTLPPAPADAEEKTTSLADSQAMMKSLLKHPGRS